MSDTTRTNILHYGGAVVFTALALLLRWLIDPWMGEHWATVTVYGAVAAAVWYGGYRPALIATILGYLACNYLFMEPRGSIKLLHLYGYIGLALYLFTCSLIIDITKCDDLGQIRHRVDKPASPPANADERYLQFVGRPLSGQGTGSAQQASTARGGSPQQVSTMEHRPCLRCK